MQEYEESYQILWRGISEALKELGEQNFGNVQKILIAAQVKAEEAFIAWPEERNSHVADTSA